jgi:hypothetical protein
MPLLAEAPPIDGARSAFEPGDRLPSCTLPSDFDDVRSLNSCGGNTGAASLEPSPLWDDLKDERWVSEPVSGFLSPWRIPQARCEANDDCEVVEPCEALRESLVKRVSLVREYGWK